MIVILRGAPSTPSADQCRDIPGRNRRLHVPGSISTRPRWMVPPRWKSSVRCRLGGRATTYNVRMLLDRRHFLGGLPALMPAGLAASAEEAPALLSTSSNSIFWNRVRNPRASTSSLPRRCCAAMQRVHKGPKIFLEAVMTPHMPQVAAIFGVDSPNRVWSISKALFADKEFSRAFDQWETGEAPYVSASASLLEATDYSPEIVAPEKPPAAPRVFELRVYHSPTPSEQSAPPAILRRRDQDLPPRRSQPDSLHHDGLRRQPAQPDLPDSLRHAGCPREGLGGIFGGRGMGARPQGFDRPLRPDQLP